MDVKYILFIIQQSLKILTGRGLAYQAVDAIARGLIATLFVQLSVLNIPMSRSANSNMLFRKLMIMNCAFLVLSCRENIKSERAGKYVFHPFFTVFIRLGVLAASYIFGPWKWALI